MDPREVIAALPLTMFQLRIIAVLFGLNALDGFDVLAIAFAAPGITHDWAISPAALGFVISLGLFGNGFGALVVAPFADKIGRRPMIFCSLAAMTCGMLICAFATGLGTLSAGRLLTGIGVGALAGELGLERRARLEGQRLVGLRRDAGWSVPAGAITPLRRS